jgi:hypothetical protein
LFHHAPLRAEIAGIQTVRLPRRKKPPCFDICRGNEMLNDRDKILSSLREKPLKIFEVMKRANISNQEACQSLLLKMRDEGSVKFDIHKGQWLIK